MTTNTSIMYPITRIEFANAREMFDYNRLDIEWDRVRGEFGDLEELLLGCDGPECMFYNKFDDYVNDSGHSYNDDGECNSDGGFWLEWSDVDGTTLLQLAHQFQQQTLVQMLGVDRVQISIDGDDQYVITIIDTDGDEYSCSYGHHKEVDEDDDEEEEEDEPVAVAPSSENDFAIDLNLNRPVLQMQATANVVSAYDSQDAEAIGIAQALANLLGVKLEILI